METQVGETTVAPLAVLLVENEDLIDLDLCDALVKAGYDVLGPATPLAGALFLLRQHTPHVAIVDVLLRDGPCTELALRLRSRGVPFVIHSGYGRHAVEIAGFAGSSWLAKPASSRDVLRSIGALSDGTQSA